MEASCSGAVMSHHGTRAKSGGLLLVCYMVLGSVYLWFEKVRTNEVDLRHMRYAYATMHESQTGMILYDLVQQV